MSTLSLWERLSEFIRAENLLHRGDTLLLAVSGGVDSMVMLDLFARIAPAWDFQLSVAHINHQLRAAESDADEAFVQKAAGDYGIPFYSTRVDTLGYAHAHHIGTQEAARRLRYEFFSALARSLNALVLTAHHANDNAETVLMNVLRGAGVRGLGGIPIRRDFIARPLLFAYRHEIEEYAREFGIPFRTDSSNEKLEYRRNVVRTILLPHLEHAGFPDAVRTLNRLARAMRLLGEHIQNEVDRVLPLISGDDPFSLFSLHIGRLMAMATNLRDEVILAVLRRLAVEPTADRVHRILQLCTKPSGSRCDVGRGIVAYRHRDELLFFRPADYQPFEVSVRPETSYASARFEFEMHVAQFVPNHFPADHERAFVDADKLGRSLTLRSWRHGDWFVPLGLQAKKKLSDFFTERKLPPVLKSIIPVLESDGAIVWVCGERIDDRFKITPQTRRVLELHYHLRHPQQQRHTAP